jgi:hypothetical protein
MDDCNNITIPHPRQGGLEGGRWGMRRTGMPIYLNVFRLLSIWRETQRWTRGLYIIEIFLIPNNATYMILIVTAMLMLDSKTLMSSAIQIHPPGNCKLYSSDGILSESTKQRPPTFHTLLQVCKCYSFHDHWQTGCCPLQLCGDFQV